MFFYTRDKLIFNNLFRLEPPTPNLENLCDNSGDYSSSLQRNNEETHIGWDNKFIVCSRLGDARNVLSETEQRGQILEGNPRTHAVVRVEVRGIEIGRETE